MMMELEDFIRQVKLELSTKRSQEIEAARRLRERDREEEEKIAAVALEKLQYDFPELYLEELRALREKLATTLLPFSARNCTKVRILPPKGER